LLKAEKVAMAEDVLEDLVVAAEPAALEARVRTGAMQLCSLEKGGVLGRT
jgi:hypothetical protein